MTSYIEPVRIELPLGIMFPSVNAFLIRGEELTLIDCGFDSEESWEQLLNAFNLEGLRIEDIDQIIITHEHRDHIGLLPRLLDQCSAKVFAPALAKEWFISPDKARTSYLKIVAQVFSSLGAPESVIQGALDFIKAVRTIPAHTNTDRFYFFEEGETLSFGGTEWVALNTPGHCPTQFVFLNEEQSRLFSGDMLLPIAPMPIITEDPNHRGHPNRPLRELVDSFHRLKKYNIQTIYPGHGPVFSEANTVIDRQLDRIGQRKQECFEAIQSGCRTSYEINRKMYPYQVMPPDFSGMYMVLGYLDLLVKDGKVSLQANADGINEYFES